MPARRRGSRKQTQKSVGKEVEHASSGKSKASQLLKPSSEEVFAAIASLYADDLKPFGRILRKRIAERSTLNSHEDPTLVSDDQLPDVDIKHVQAICADSDCIRVEEEEGGDWSAVILGREKSFVDIYSDRDVYPSELWKSMARYFQDSAGKDTTLPGGRYACARTLSAQSIVFLSGYSLGKVCHIVQLAMSQKKILGYYDGSVVPYARSQSKMKEDCANCAKPCKLTGQERAILDSAPSSMPIADWDTTRKYLQEILDNAPEPATGNRTVPLSNVKRVFRSKYNTELSETKLGYAKLSDLLQAPELSDVCTVRLGGFGYVVEQVCDALKQSDQTESTKSIDSDDDSQKESSQNLSDECPGELLSELLDLSQQNDFDDTFDSLLPWTMGKSPDFEHGFFDQDEPQTRRSQFSWDPLPLDGIEEMIGYSHSDACPYLSKCSVPSPSLNPGERHIGGIAISKIKNTFIHSPVLPPTPLRQSASRRAQSLPRNVGSDNDALEATYQALGCRREKPDIPPVQCGFEASSCTTPNPYDGYHSLSCVPPSPALTASPMWIGRYNSPYVRHANCPPTGPPLPLPCGFSCDTPSPSTMVISLAALLA